MNTKVCAILFAGATLATEIEKTEAEKNWKACVKDNTYAACSSMLNGAKNLGKSVFNSHAKSNTEKSIRTEALGDLVEKLRKVIKQMQKPAGCDQSEEEIKQVKEIMKNAIQSVGDSLEDFKKNLPQDLVKWMEDAKDVLMRFSEKINHQPTEEEMKALLEDLKIEKLQDIVQKAQESAAVGAEEKENMLKVQRIVAPLQNVKDQASLFKILTQEVVPAMSENLSPQKIDAFVETANKWLDDIPRVASYMQCQAAQAAQGKSEF